MKKEGGKDDVEGQIAQINFFFVALANLISMSMTTFRYRSSSTYYDAGDVLSTNYWKMANLYGSYFWIGGMGIVTITQFLAIFGIANQINLYVWTGLDWIGLLVSIATSTMLFLAYDAAYTKANESGASGTDVANANAVMQGVWNDWVKGTIEGVLSEGVLVA